VFRVKKKKFFKIALEMCNIRPTHKPDLKLHGRPYRYRQIKSNLLNNKGLEATYKLLKTFNRHTSNKRYMYTLLITTRDVAFLYRVGYRVSTVQLVQLLA